MASVLEEDVLFTKKMRKATRDIHNISDALVNAKLGIALSDDSVWAEGLLVFYDIFAFLEGALERMGSSLLGELDVEGMRRRAAFESDLRYYLGPDWLSEHRPRPAVQRYLDHLQQLEELRPHLLLVYVYHMYMGMLSGGQILRKKRQLVAKLLGRRSADGSEAPGNAVTSYGGYRIGELKRQLVDSMNHCAELLDEETRQQMIEESRQLFARNNEIVATVRGATRVLLRKLRNFTVVISLLLLVFWLLFW